ncbi:membrane integrity-associated transporter subunit PqiC [Castellaniella hirudinis]|uniref:Membrane integrity-associated transporter subunit PqiC n=1 Tax=Castellaniella hirudinis TaxID=1144617 RepID=A0ABV8RYK6_9BURK
MKRTISTWACRLGLAGLLAGCAAPPIQYYSLAAPATDQPVSGVAGAAAQGGLSLAVTRIPVEAERLQLVVRDPARDPAVQVLNDSLWAAPLGDQIRAALADGLGRRLGAVDPRRLSEAQARSVRRIEVRIDRFDLVWGRFVALDADWTDRAPGADRSRVCRASVRLPAAASVAALVEAQRQALDRLAALIAAGTSGAPADLQGGSTLSKSGCT